MTFTRYVDETAAGYSHSVEEAGPYLYLTP